MDLPGGLTGASSLTGYTHNAWCEGRSPGGSSSGSAVAVAAGYVPLAIGTDTAGSVRIPAAFNGLFGLRMTKGALSIEGIVPFQTWIYHAADNSFPSDHGTLFFSAGLSLLLSGAKRSGIFILILAGFVAWSRVFLGVHFPLDMPGAALMAVLACVVVRPLWAHWGEALTVLCESLSVRLFSWLRARLTP